MTIHYKTLKNSDRTTSTALNATLKASKLQYHYLALIVLMWCTLGITCWLILLYKQSFGCFLMFMSVNWICVRNLKVNGCTKLCPLSTECLVTFDCSHLPPCSSIIDASLLGFANIYFQYMTARDLSPIWIMFLFHLVFYIKFIAEFSFLKC